MIFRIFKLLFICFSFVIFSQNILAETSNQSVRVEIAKKKIVSDNLNLLGSILANEEVIISSLVSDKIKKIDFQEGKNIKKGMLLIELENSEERALVNQFRAELDEAILNFNRAEKLNEQGNASQSLLDKKLMEKKRLEAIYDQATAKLNNYIIKSPIDGIIGTRNFSQGSFVNPGEAITTIYDIEKIKVIFYVPESYSNKIKINQVFSLTLPSQKKLIREGKVFAMEHKIEENTRTMKVIGLVSDNTNFNLKPGMMANITIKLNERKSIVVKEGSIVPKRDKNFVYSVDKKNTVFKKEVSTGQRTDGYIEILKGVNENERIIFEGTNKIKDGMKVEIIE